MKPMNSLEIQRLKRSINLGLADLEARNMELAEVFRELSSLKLKISELNVEVNLISTGDEHLKRHVTIIRDYLKADEKRHILLRDMDIEASKVAAYLSVAIDDVMAEKNTSLKFYIKRSLANLKDGYIVKISDSMAVHLSPSASALGILTPYLVRTRILDDASWFASIRNGIRELMR